MSRPLPALLLTTLLAARPAPVAAQTPIVFPAASGHETAVAGPWRITWIKATEHAPHQLLLGRGAGPATPLLSFERHVEVLWGPQARFVAITDAYASTDSRVFLLRPEAPQARIELPSAAQPIPPATLAGLHPDHQYLRAVRWLGDSLLELRWEAYGEGRGVAASLRFHVRTGFEPSVSPTRLSN